MGRPGSGFDPRIIIAAVLAQQQAAKGKPGIPLISDQEAERRQLEADRKRRRRATWWRLVAVFVLVVVAILVLSSLLPSSV